MAKENIWDILKDGSGKMKISRGKIHEYLVSTLDFLEQGYFKIDVIPYIE